MAKGNMLLGKARGSVGDLTFSVSYGEQISRAKAKSVKNPRTDAQMIQRIIMATTVQAYSGMQAIVDHSFQGVAYQGPSMNKFNSLNSKALRSAYAAAQGKDAVLPLFNRNGMKTIALNEYVMSTGSLPVVELPTRVSEEYGTEEIITDFTEYGEAPNVSYGSTGVAIAKASSLTYAQVIAMFGLQAGDQLTLCALTRKNGDVERGCQFKFGRFILMPADGDLSHNITDASVANEKNQNAKFVSRTISVNGSDMACQCLAFEDLDIAGEANTTVIYAAGVIVSRLEGNSWKRNNCVLKMAVSGDDLIDGGYSMQQAIDSYSASSIETNSPWYLNKAGKSTTAEPVGVLAKGELGFIESDGVKLVAVGASPIPLNVTYQEGSSYYDLRITDEKAFGMTLQSAFENGFVEKGSAAPAEGVPYTKFESVVIKYATNKA